MASPKQLFIDLFEAVNARDWAKVQTAFAPTVDANGVDTSAEALTQRLAGLTMIGPDMISTVDLVLESADRSAAYARLVHTSTLTQEAMGVSVTGKPVAFAEASFFWVNDEGKVNKTQTILDLDPARKGESAVPQVGPTLTFSSPAPEGLDLLATYKSYLDTVQKGLGAEEMSKYCHDSMIVNGTEATLEQFLQGLAGAKAAIEGMTWTLEDAVVDEAKQQLAARVMLSGKPVADFAGVAPTGGSVSFPEHVLYQFDGGKIKHVVQMMDLDTYRAALSPQD